MPDDPRVECRVTRRFDAPPEAVFDAWIDPSKAERFLFATEQGEMVRVEIDPRAGGRYSIVERREGEDVEHTGEYLEVDRPRRLVFTLQVPKYADTVDRVTVETSPAGAGTELAVVHEVAPEWADQAEEGWSGILDGLAKLLHPRSRQRRRGPATGG